VPSAKISSSIMPCRKSRAATCARIGETQVDVFYVIVLIDLRTSLAVFMNTSLWMRFQNSSDIRLRGRTLDFETHVRNTRFHKRISPEAAFFSY